MAPPMYDRNSLMRKGSDEESVYSEYCATPASYKSSRSGFSFGDGFGDDMQYTYGRKDFPDVKLTPEQLNDFNGAYDTFEEVVLSRCQAEGTCFHKDYLPKLKDCSMLFKVLNI